MEDSENYSKTDMNIDKVLEELGPFGRYQALILFLVCIPNFFGAMYGVHYVFTVEDINYRCLVPECEDIYSTNYVQPWSNYSSSSRCFRYNMTIFNDTEECSADSFDITATTRCDSWIYETPDSFVGEFRLACQDYKRTMIGSIRSVATVFALILTGFVSDTFGRKPAFCIFSFCLAIFGVTKSFAGGYFTFAILEFLEALFGYGYNTASYVLVIELARPSMRVLFVSMTGISYGIGGAIFGVIASQIPYWRNLLRAIYIPAFFFLTYIFVIDESPRWLYVKGKNEQAIRVIQKAARWNKVDISKKSIDFLHLQQSNKKLRASEGTKKTLIFIKVLYSQRLIFRVILCSLIWISVTFVYYGLTINSVSLAGNKYLNFSLGSLAEVVATLFIMMSLERYGRRKCILVSFIMCGVSCITPLIDDSIYTQTTFFFVGKLAITYAFNSMYIYTSELFPTEARSSFLSSCSLIGRLGSILAPQTPLLALYNEILPSLLFAGVSILAALLVLIIPETLNTRLPETVSEAESIDNLKLDKEVVMVTEL